MRNTARQKMAAELVRWAHDYLGLTWDEVGSMLGTTGRTVQRWRTLDSIPSRAAQVRLDEAAELRSWLRTVFDGEDDAAHEWLRTRLLDLGGETPLHAIRAGRLGLVSEFLATFHSGAHI